MEQKLHSIAAIDQSRIEFINISGEALRCRITAGDGTAISFVAHPGMRFSVDGFDAVPKIDADYICN